MRHGKYIFILIFVFMSLVGVFLFWFFILQQRFPLPAPASELFARYVSDPIPDSVAEIRASQTKGFNGYGYTFRFIIDKADVDAIINARPFNKVTSIEYQEDILHCMWEPASGPTGLTKYVYSPGVYKPSWFKLEEWDDPEAYIIYETKENIADLWLLVYNKDVGKAYFIVENIRMW